MTSGSRRSFAGAFTVVAVLMSVACQDGWGHLSLAQWLHEKAGRKSGTFRGHYVSAFETSAFEPCGSGEKWWVEGNIVDLRKPANPSEPGEWEPREFYVEWRGTRSATGNYGHMGDYLRELEVSEVLVARPYTPDACK